MRGDLVSRASIAEREDPQGHQRHRAARDGARSHGPLPAGRRSPRRCAGARGATGASRRQPADVRATRRRARRADEMTRHPDAAACPRDAPAAASAGTAASLCTPAPTAARFVAKLSRCYRSSNPRPINVDLIVRHRIPRSHDFSPMRSTAMGFQRHRQGLDERHAGGLGRREDPHRLARDPLRQRRVRRRALL